MRVALVLISCSLLAVAAAPAWATFPGRNGEIAYIDSWGSDVEYNMELWGVCPNGSRQRALGTQDLDAGSSTFSPDGRVLAASRDYQYDSYGSSIWLVRGKRERRVTRQLRRASDHSPVWAPRGGEIAFTRARSDDDFDVRSRAIRVYSGGHSSFLTRGWGPDWSVLNRIAFHRQDRHGSNELGSSIYVVSANGGAVRRLMTGWAHDWSPNGRRLLVTYRAKGPARRLPATIAVISANGTGLRGLASGSQPSWSPDGRWIAFVTPEGYAAVISPHGGDPKLLGRTSGGASFSPDSKWLAITRGNNLYVLPLKGGGRHFVTEPESGEDMTFLDWGVRPAGRAWCR
jgi:Tol biopolymer transport system component